MKYLRDNAFLKELGLHIKKVRKKHGYTQEKLAFQIGVEISQISRIERGVVNTSVSTIHAIAKELEVETMSLFDFE